MVGCGWVKERVEERGRRVWWNRGVDEMVDERDG